MKQKNYTSKNNAILLVFIVTILSLSGFYACGGDQTAIDGDSEGDPDAPIEDISSEDTLIEHDWDEDGADDTGEEEGIEFWSDYTKMVPMSDGVKLKTDVFFPPEATDRLSAIIERTPYGIYDTGNNPDGLGYLLKRGYILVIQQVRGRGGSEGEFIPLSNEYADGGEAVEWVLSQPWSNGLVATFGASYLGYTAIAAAAANPNVTVVVSDGSPLGGFDAWPSRRGGSSIAGGIHWYSLMEGWITYDLEDASLISNHFPALTLDEAIMGSTLQWHRDLVDAYSNPGSLFWVTQTLRDRLTGYCIPTVHIQAYMEYADDPSEIFEVIQQNGCEITKPYQKLIFSRWYHGETTTDWDGTFNDPSVRDNPAHDIIDRFLTHYLDGSEDDLTGIPEVTFYDHTLAAWRNVDAWPPSTSELTFHLGSGHDLNSGTLTIEPPADENQVSYVYDPETQDPCDDSLVATYFSGELEEKFTLYGRPRVHLEASSSATDTEFWFNLYALPPSSSEWEFITSGAVRASYRNGADAPAPLTAGERTVFDLSLDRLIYTLTAGTLLSIGISSAQCVENENPNSGESIGKETARTEATQTIFLDGEGSTITFDILE